MTNRQIEARFTDRIGGGSEFPYTSCNLGLHVGDDPVRVIANRDEVAREFGVSLDSWVAGEQVHGNNVTVVTAQMRGRGARDLESMLPATDALITNVPGITLTTYAADCVPLLFSDANKLVIGVAHAGWQGTVLKIGGETVRAMQETYGCDPADIHVQIGPSIGPCCYEVDQRVHDRVTEAFPDDHAELLTPNANGRWQLDLWLCNVKALLEAGVRPEHIHREDRCTSCDAEHLFSHRKEQGRTGRHAGLITIRES